MEVALSALVVAEGLGLAQSLRLALPRRFGIHILGPVADEDLARAALKTAAATPVDLVVVDLARQDGRAFDIVASLADDGNRVLAMVPPVREDDAARALAAGATGAIRGTSGVARNLANSLRGVAAGMLVLPEADLSKMVSDLRSRPAFERISVQDLTAREMEVIRVMAEGAPLADVAAALGISPLTVRSHLKNVMSKLGVHSKVEVATFALRAGLTDRRSA